MRSLVDRSRALGSLKQTWGNCQRFLPESEGGRHNHSLSIWVLMCLTVFLCFWVSVCLFLLTFSLPPLYLCPSLSSPPLLPPFPSFSFDLSVPSLPPPPNPVSPPFLSLCLTYDLCSPLWALRPARQSQESTPDYRVVVRAGSPAKQRPPRASPSVALSTVAERSQDMETLTFQVLVRVVSSLLETGDTAGLRKSRPFIKR